MSDGHEALLEALLDGEHRALARTISKIENRAPGYRDLVSDLYEHAGEATVIGITGSPGAGKSTLVDKLAEAYRDQGRTVGVIAIDPSSPYTGGAVLGDRVRMASTVGDMEVFVRSMSARGSLGGLSTATADAVTAMDAFGKDTIIIETVGAGQNEIDIVKTADSVAVLVPPGSGDEVQTLKAGILEIADVFVVNKADRTGADRTVQELEEMIDLGEGDPFGGVAGHHGPDATPEEVEAEPSDTGWRPPVIQTVATDGSGLEELLTAFDDHRSYLVSSGAGETRAARRTAEMLRTLLREDLHDALESEIEGAGGIDTLVDRIRRGETDPYSVADEVIEPVEACLEELED